MPKKPHQDFDSLRPRTVRISDRDWETIVGIAEGCLREPGELLRLLTTPSPLPDAEGNHAPHTLKLMHPDHPGGLLLRNYVCRREKPMAGVGDQACPFCAIRAIVDQSRCNLALGIVDLRAFLDGLRTPTQRKAAVWFSTNVILLMRTATQ